VVHSSPASPRVIGSAKQKQWLDSARREEWTLRPAPADSSRIGTKVLDVIIKYLRKAGSAAPQLDSTRRNRGCSVNRLLVSDDPLPPSPDLKII
jgi:hypothetical protein